MLDEAGFPKAKIVASGDLDENVIADLKQQGAKIDVWGVGTRLITGHDQPALGGVYKLAAVYQDGQEIPKLKVSENVAKITNPGMKKIARIYSNADSKAIADLIMLDHETIDESQPLTIFDPIETWKHMTIENFHVKYLLVPVFVEGKQVYDLPVLTEIQEYSKAEKQTFWDEFMRIKRPHVYKVDLSDELYNLKKKLLRDSKKN